MDVSGESTFIPAVSSRIFAFGIVEGDTDLFASVGIEILIVGRRSFGLRGFV